MDIGVFSYDNPAAKKNGEFDVALRFDDGYDVYEVKFLKDCMDKNLMEEEIGKIMAIPSFKARNIGFVSSSGFACSPNDVILISGEDIYDV